MALWKPGRGVKGARCTSRGRCIYGGVEPCEMCVVNGPMPIDPTPAAEREALANLIEQSVQDTGGEPSDGELLPFVVDPGQLATLLSALRAPAAPDGEVGRLVEGVRSSAYRHGGTYESSPFDYYCKEPVDQLLAALSRPTPAAREPSEEEVTQARREARAAALREAAEIADAYAYEMDASALRAKHARDVVTFCYRESAAIIVASRIRSVLADTGGRADG